MKTTRCALMVSAVFSTALAAIASGQAIWVSHGPNDVGWINDLAIADSVAYAATTNGVFISHDRGARWQRSGLEGRRIDKLAARPGADVVLAVGDDSSLHVSRDRGESWAPLSGLPLALAVGIDPNQLSTIYAGTYDTIWKSTDAGASWQSLPAPGDYRPEAFAFSSGAVYVLSSSHLFKSVDGGISWISVLDSVGAIAAGAVDGVIYAAAFLGGEGSFCRSADSAATWTCSASLAFYYPTRILEIPGPTPANPRLIASTQNEAFLSEDGGATWTPAGGGLEGSIQSFASDTTGSLVLAGTDTQVFRSEDRGDTWTPFRVGLKALSIGALALDPQNPSTIWAGGFGEYPSGPGLFRSTDNGLSWLPAGGPQGPQGVKALLIDPENPRTMYAGWDRVFRTDDAGATWTSSLIPGSIAPLTSLAIDPTDSRRVWASTGRPGLIRVRGNGPWTETGAGLFQSDGARTWRDASIARSVYSILFDKRRPGTIYAGSYDDFTREFGYPNGIGTGGSIFISRDYGSTFTKADIDFGGRVRSIVADPFDDDRVYVSTGALVVRSNDGGETWAHSVVGRIDQIVTDPVRPGRLYGSGPGVLRSDDGARTWHPFSEGLPPNISTGPLVISPDGRWLYVGTESAGVFARDLEAKPPSFPCEPGDTRLCLVGNRYAVELVAARKGESTFQPGAARPLGDRAGYFGLPAITGNPDLPEVVVKMLADGTFGHPGAPFFYSSLTTVNYGLTVTDTMTGEETFYVNNPEQPLCGRTELLFDESESPQSLRPERATGADETELKLLGGRFSVTLEARRARDGRTAPGVITASGDVYGIFSLPGITGDATFPEVAVKMVDARSFTGKFWFFHTGLTSLDYTLTVTDSVTGAVQTYTSPTPFCGAADTKAFAD